MSAQPVEVQDFGPTPHLLTPTELAQYLGVSVGALAQLRYTGRGPAFTKAGRQVRYRMADVQAYLDANTRTITEN